MYPLFIIICSAVIQVIDKKWQLQFSPWPSLLKGRVLHFLLWEIFPLWREELKKRPEVLCIQHFLNLWKQTWKDYLKNFSNFTCSVRFLFLNSLIAIHLHFYAIWATAIVSCQLISWMLHKKPYFYVINFKIPQRKFFEVDSIKKNENKPSHLLFYKGFCQKQKIILP